MLADPGDQATYTFTGSPGQVLYFDPRDATPGLRAALGDPLGVAVFTGALSSGDPGPFTLTRAGTYTLTISANSGADRRLRLRPGRRRGGDARRPGARRGQVESGTLASGLATACTPSPAPPASGSTSRGSRTRRPPARRLALQPRRHEQRLLPPGERRPGDARGGRDLPAGRPRGQRRRRGGRYRFEAFEDVAQTAAWRWARR